MSQLRRQLRRGHVVLDHTYGALRSNSQALYGKISSTESLWHDSAKSEFTDQAEASDKHMPPGIRKRLPYASGARYQAGHKNGASPAYVQNQDQSL